MANEEHVLDVEEMLAVLKDPSIGLMPVGWEIIPDRAGIKKTGTNQVCSYRCLVLAIERLRGQATNVDGVEGQKK